MSRQRNELRMSALTALPAVQRVRRICSQQNTGALHEKPYRAETESASAGVLEASAGVLEASAMESADTELLPEDVLSFTPEFGFGDTIGTWFSVTIPDLLSESDFLKSLPAAF